MIRHVTIITGMLIAATAVMYSTAPIDRSANRPDAQQLSQVVEEIEGLDALRSGLAASFSGEPDATTFGQVCKPVGARMRELAEETGWTIQQLALKNRNPNNTLDPEAELIYRMMDDTPEIMGLWLRTEMVGNPGFRYYRRIVVEPTCLGCHGPRDGRPQFVKDGYPDDRAYNFEVGDLRGIYSAFIADQ
ncbi:MAG TPA: DUF3365 domain-containing protein [Gemmatimonadota bacterium]|nr:DUF3365 domain-containing protein [Gemmatimonadota bacterium]